MAAPLQILRAPLPSVVPFLCRGRRWGRFAWKPLNRYRMPPIKLDPQRNKHKRDIPLFFGHAPRHYPVAQAGGSLSWAEPIFAAYKKRLEQTEQEESESEDIHKLHAVCRVPRSLYGAQKVLKKIMKALGLHPKQIRAGQFVILKNSEENNEYLLQVKKFIRIIPVTFPYGEPTENDLQHVYMTENAEVLVHRQLHALKVIDNRPEDKWAIEKDTIVRGNRKRIQEQRVSLEYFPPNYVYRYNQDGKEYRYNHNLPKTKSA